MATTTEILRILDSCCDTYKFPMLDSGYEYLAATRLSLFRSASDWAMVIELFGFHAGTELPSLTVSTFASTLTDRDPPTSYVTSEAFENYLRDNPHNESRTFFPIDEGSWQDSEDNERVATSTEAEFVLRGLKYRLPSRAEYPRHGIELAEPDRVRIYELCRYLAAVMRDDVLATAEERRVSVASGMQQLLVLDDWRHPDLVGGERPSELESFKQLARVLETGDAGLDHPTIPGNTHWKHWPEGGTL